MHKLVDEKDPVLHEETEAFNFEEPQMDPEELEKVLLEKMIEHGGVGLSANQLGIKLRAFAFGDPKTPESCSVVFNPKIVNQSEVMVTQEEGCLSYPHLIVKVSRPHEVRIRGANKEGETKTHHFKGFTARIVQHEIDHLDGITIVDRAKKFHLQKALNKRRIALRKAKK